jgi:hypothetical protein
MTKSMYKSILTVAFRKIYFLLLIVALFVTNESKASHATGSDLTYTSLGNGQYLVTFSFYRDCAGIDAPTTQTLTVQSTLCNFAPQTFTLNAIPGTGQEITHPCSTQTTTCTPGGTQPGIQLWEYTCVVTLNGQCGDWQFSCSVNARNAAVNNMVNAQNSDLFVDAFLNNTQSENNSPIFSLDPIAFVCEGQVNHINHGGVDADGDSLVYSFITPRGGPNTPLNYQNGYSVQQPLTSNPPVTIDPFTGDITMTPTALNEVAAMAILIQEYRNGDLIGQVMRDMQVYVVHCTNTLPEVSGIDTTTSFSTSTCVGSPLCFSVVSTDPDPLDTLTMIANVTTIPGATFTISSGPRPVGTFCWTPTPADARTTPYTFNVTIRDNACPSNGTTSKQYFVVVSNMNIALTSTPSVTCNGLHTGSASATASGNPPLQYAWTLPNSTVLTTPSISHLGAGNYTLNVTDNTGCVGTEYFTITEPAQLTVNVVPTNAGCGGAQVGSALANVAGGTQAYSYVWSNNATSNPITGLQTGHYSVAVTDANGCTTSGATDIQAVNNVDFTPHSTPATCVGNDGSAWVTHVGGVGPFSYAWSNNITDTTATQNNLIANTYSVVATDLGTGCNESLTTTVANTSGLSATIVNSTDVTCGSTEDGTATVSATGGQPPYAYLWPNGDTTAMTNHLGGGIQTVMVEDYAGCRAYAQATIDTVNPSPVVALGLDTNPCIGTPYMMDAGAGGASYLWSDGSTGQTLTVGSSGTYSVIVTNQAGCEASDNINVTFVTCFTHHSSSLPVNIFVNTSGTKATSNIYIYPNPAIYDLNVSIPNARETEVNITMNDIIGNTLYKYSENAQSGFFKKVDIHSMPAGIYLLKVEYNGEVSTSRVVKQ